VLIALSSFLDDGILKSLSLLYYWSEPDLYHGFSVEVKDISLTDYIQVRHPVWVPHTAGRYAKKRFKKAQMPIVERLVDSYVFIDINQF
jgi:hypothetical protein